MTSTTTLKLTLTKSTKGTHVYGSDDKDAAVPSVYIKRSALPADPPQAITLTLEHD